MKKIAFLCPYFGKLPEYFQLWLNSCKSNSNSTFFLITDDRNKFNYPNNVHVIYKTFDDFRKDVQKKFDFKIALSSIHKIGDFKPALGYIYKELIDGYDAWAYIDVSDEIYGDISKFVNDEMLNKYDKIMLLGHLSIIKNNDKNNLAFMREIEGCVNYKEVFSSPSFFNFEEVTKNSINTIYKNADDLSLKNLSDNIADLSCLAYRFKRVICDENFDFKFANDSKFKSIYEWNHGKIFGYFIIGSTIQKKEFLYIHFKRRKMNVNIPLNSQRYLITPSGFYPYLNVTSEIVRKYGKGKILYSVYLKTKFASLVQRVKKVKELL